MGNIDTPATSLDRGREAKLSVDNLLKEFDQIHETQDSRETINWDHDSLRIDNEDFRHMIITHERQISYIY